MSMSSALPTPEAPKTDLAGPARAGALVSLALIVVLGLWLTFTMIAGAVIASGQAVVRGNPKVVQSLDGGVIDEIHATDGDVVEAGQLLVRLDPTLLEINLDIYRNRLAEALVREARLQAEYAGDDAVTFPPPPAVLKTIPMEQAQAGEREIFAARAEVLKGTKEQLAERIAQFKNQATGAEGRITATRDQLAFVQSQLESQRQLKNQGLARESQVLELQGREAELLGTLSEALSDQARIQNSINDTELEILQTGRQFKEEVVTELRKVTANREELTLQIVTVQKQLERIDIRAPVDGVVHEMQVFTVGGVVPPDGTLLKVVPVSDGVDFELRVDPRSIDQVFVGQRARLVFPAFNARTTPEIFGNVATVSPTSIEDPVTRTRYYRVDGEVDAERDHGDRNDQRDDQAAFESNQVAPALEPKHQESEAGAG
jgi:HlyD family secretion protein